MTAPSNCYRPTPLYRVLVAASLLAAALCGWSLTQQFDWVTVLFLVGCLYAGGTYALQGRSWVVVDAEGLLCHSPSRTRRVRFGQLDNAVEAGRWMRRIVVTYYPLQPDGLVDLHQLSSLALPAVERQDLLLADLVEHVPGRGG